MRGKESRDKFRNTSSKMIFIDAHGRVFDWFIFSSNNMKNPYLIYIHVKFRLLDEKLLPFTFLIGFTNTMCKLRYFS